jgi:hypothetical protein
MYFTFAIGKAFHTFDFAKTNDSLQNFLVLLWSHKSRRHARPKPMNPKRVQTARSLRLNLVCGPHNASHHRCPLSQSSYAFTLGASANDVPSRLSR